MVFSKTVRKAKYIYRFLGSEIEFWNFYFISKLFGISTLNKYLRNPNPEIVCRLLRSFGASIGEGVKFKQGILFDNIWEDKNSAGDFRYLKIGKNCYIGTDVYFDLANEVILGDNVIVSGHVSFITHADCNRSDYLNKKFPRKCLPVQVENGAWIGFGATILTGVVIGENSIVAANSLVRQCIEPKALYSGVPAKRIRDL